ncbi:MAG: YfhO family protein, partial [Lachnospiraceae bacterium]|nr:YfhO family protein [Lachnospiraceae bacterium]
MIGKKKRFSWVNAGPYLVAFFVPILVMIIVFIERGIWPFGDRCFLRTDLYHQYAPFFQELHKKLATGGSLFYDWNIGMGTNFWTLSAYYLIDPFNLLAGIIPHDYIIELVTGLIVNKIALCSLTMAYYLNVRHDKHGIDGYMGAFIGIFYALSGYMAAYNWNVMWLDCLWLFPLIILGLEKLFKEGKGLLYSVSLGFSILTNYYIAIMSCMGIALYCFFLLATEREMLKKFWLKLLKFIGYTVLAVAFSSVVLIPYVNYFGMTASATNSFKWEWRSYFSVFEMLGRHLINVEVHTGLDHWPNIFAGVAVFMLIPFYYLNKKVTLREKIGYTVLLLFFYFSFSTRAMDYIWHVFHIPNSLPCRQAYIYIFLLLVMCYRGLMGLKDRSYRDITFAMIGALLFVFITQYLEKDNTIYAQYVIWISAVFMILYAILFYVHRRGRLYRDVVIVLFIALAAIETCVNTSVTSVPTVGRNDYMNFDTGVRAVMEEIREKEGPDAFYRVEKTQIRTKNDGAWLDYPSISTFSSVANANLTEFYHLIGMESSTNAYGSVGQTFFTNMLLGVKYSIAQKALEPNDALYTLVGTNHSNVWVYENKCVLPLGFLLPSELIDSWYATSTNPILNENALAELVSGEHDLFIECTPSYTSDTSVSITIREDGYYYAYPPKSGPKEIEIKHDNFSRKFSNLNRGYVMELGFCKAGESVTMTNK